jgi:tetratricopeptide (TPR) repeat protein
VNDLLIGLLGTLLATNQPQAVSNLVRQTTGFSVAVPDPSDPVEKEYRKLLEDDDAAQAEVDRWILDNQRFAEKGGGLSPDELRERILTRFAPVRKAYEDFLQCHPNHARAHLAYGSFLNDIRDEEGAEAQWEKARELEPQNPAAWNNLANLYAHGGPAKKAFEYFAKAIELNPFEPTYYYNLATMVFLFRPDAMEYYGINEQQVFDKALDLYAKALKLDPNDFPLASEIARTYYGIEPMRTEAALKAWDYALKIARDDTEREGVCLHFARIKINAGRFAEARQHLDAVTNAQYDVVKKRLLRTLSEKEAKAAATNNPPSLSGTQKAEGERQIKHVWPR